MKKGNLEHNIYVQCMTVVWYIKNDKTICTLILEGCFSVEDTKTYIFHLFYNTVNNCDDRPLLLTENILKKKLQLKYK